MQITGTGFLRCVCWVAPEESPSKRAQETVKRCGQEGSAFSVWYEKVKSSRWEWIKHYRRGVPSHPSDRIGVRAHVNI